MTVVINGNTGITSPSPFVLEGSTSGTVTVAAPAVAGTNTQTLVAATDTLAPVVRGTAVTASGTSVEFTGIPSWVKKITIMFQGVSTNGSAPLQIQVGSGSYSTSGYLGSGANAGSGGAPLISLFTTGFGLMQSSGAVSVYHGTIWLSNLSGNNWIESAMLARSDTAAMQWSGGSIALGGVLDRVRVIGSATGTPSDTFDAGTVNILYE